MTFRITRLDNPQGPVIRIDGWLRREGLAELEREIQRASAQSSARLTLDLAGLRWADEGAVALLRSLVADGTRLVDCAPYLAMRLGAPPGPDGHDAP